ncbi:MAG: hypothetical protein ACRCXB_04500 [Aeromonadaceae bacterium]
MSEEVIEMGTIQLSETHHLSCDDDNLISIQPAGKNIIPFNELPDFILSLQEALIWHQRKTGNTERPRKTAKVFTVPVDNTEHAALMMEVLSMFGCIPPNCELAGVKYRSDVDAITLSPIPRDLLAGVGVRQ